MELNIPSLLCLVFLVFALFQPTKYLLYASFALLPFGALAILPPALVGGVTILVGSAAFMFLVFKSLLLDRGMTPFLRNAFSLKYLGFLTLFTVVAVIGAFVLPKLLIGKVYIFAIRPTTRLVIPEPLQPSSGNLTQSAYIVISFMTAAVFCELVKRKNFIKDFGTALIFGAGVTAFTGVLDMVTSAAGVNDILSIFRNATYAIMTEGEIAGVKRIIGLMPEASAFGSLAVTFFALLLFCRNIFTPQQRTRVVLPLALINAALAGLSTSSTAYVALAVVVVIYFWDAAGRLNLGTKEEKKQTMTEFTAIVAFALFGLIFLMCVESTRETVFALIDQMVFKKSKSSSFIERTSWNTQAMDALMQTNGVGLGLGSVRSSNMFVNIMASTGIVGTIFFSIFLLKVVFIKPRAQGTIMAELVHNCKLALIPIATMQLMVGTIPDYGVVVGALFGLIIGGGYAQVKIASEPARRPEFGDDGFDYDIAAKPPENGTPGVPPVIQPKPVSFNHLPFKDA